MPQPKGASRLAVGKPVLVAGAGAMLLREVSVNFAAPFAGAPGPFPAHGVAEASRKPSAAAQGGQAAGLSSACVALATSAGLALAGAKAAGRKSHGAKTRALQGGVEGALQGGVEGVRILGGWSAGSPMSQSGKLHQELSANEMSTVAEGVAQLAFVVEKGRTNITEEFELGTGTTENTYILFDPDAGLDGDGPVLLVDVPEQRFSSAFVERLAPYMKRIEGLIITSVDEENAPVVETLAHEHLKGGADARLKVYTSKAGKTILKNYIKDAEVLKEMDVIGIDDDSYIPLPHSNASTSETERPHLDVVDTSNPKVPEGMGVFDERTGLFFSGKFFSAHVTGLGVNPSWENCAVHWHHFFDCYFFTSSAQAAVRRIFQLAADNSSDELGLHSPDVKVLAPRHGPVVKDEAWKVMAKYEAWLERKMSATRDGTVLVLFASAYGNTTTMARAIERGVEVAGAKAQMMNCEFCTAEEIKAAYEQCNAVAIGSPTLGGQMPIQMKEALGVILNSAQQGNQQNASVRKGAFSSSRVPCGVFGSFGWSGEAVDELYIRLKDTGFEFAFDPIRCKFKPTEKVIGECEAAGERLVQKSNAEKKARKEAIDEKMGAKLEKKQVDASGNSVIQAFGQIVNASCILTMIPEEGKAELRLPVSWVSQASFTPLGIMLAVEKERLDSFMQLPLEEQLTILFKRYDADDSGELDKEEAENLLDELFGAMPGSASAEVLRATKDEAWELLDADGSGSCDVKEFRAAATEGPLADLIAQQRKVASLESTLSGADGADFTLSMLPEGMSAADAMDAALAKKKTKNGCPAVKGATSYVECKLTGLMNAGKGTVLYASVLAGDVLDKEARTGLLKANHVPQVAEAPVEEASDAVEAPSLVRAARSQPPSGGASMASAFAGVSMKSRQMPGTRAQQAMRRALALKGPETMSASEKWTGLTPGKEYQLQTLCQEVAENTRTIRSLDWQRDRFDIEFALTNGTTYNAYTIKGATHTALIDASHKKFETLFMDALESPEGGAIDLATLDYLVVSHTEPDHSGLVENILIKAKEKGNEKITVVGTKICITFLSNLVHMDFNQKVVKAGDQIDLGGGHVLDFVAAPNLHWPDTMFTYDSKTQLLYTCDAFGMHYCSENVTDIEGVDALLPHYQLYYNCLMRPNARSVLTALKKAGALPGEVSAIATGHGPVLVESKDAWLDKYKTWSEKATAKLGPAVCIFWCSRHGESERLAQAFAYGLTQQDILVEMHDLNAVDAFEVVEACQRNQVITIFAPPKGEGIAQTNIGSAIASCNAKDHKFVICSSGAGSNEEPVSVMVERCVQQTGIAEGLPALRMQPGSEEKTLAYFEDCGRQLAKTLQSKKKQAAKDKLDQQTTEALGKMCSGRYIVTGQKGEISSAGVVTWVMPASSDPPSVAVAVSKDHALQSLMQPGDTFVLNMLEEGNYLDLVKHFQQDMVPGQDILQDVDTSLVAAGDANGIAVTGCSAYLVCKVYSRMDAGDHTLICGEALAGKVVRDAPTAANFRKSAAYY